MVRNILRRKAVERATGLPRSTLYDLISRGDFPKQVPLTGRSVGWLESEVAAWQSERVGKRDDVRGSVTRTVVVGRDDEPSRAAAKKRAARRRRENVLPK